MGIVNRFRWGSKMTQSELIDLNSILRFVHMHAPEMHRVEGDHVLVGGYVSHADGDYCELAELRTMGEAREWLGY